MDLGVSGTRWRVPSSSPSTFVPGMIEAMIPCPTCERFVGGSSRECPFCGTVLRDTAAVSASTGGMAGILLGLALAACGTEPGSEETTAVDTTSSSTSSTTEDPSATSTSSGQITSLDEDSVGEVAAYAGPGSFTDTFPDTTGDTDGTSTGTGTGTGTDTGTGTSTDTGTDTGTGTSSG